MRRKFFLLSLFLIPLRSAHACGCFNTATVLDDYQQADFVIVAQLKTLIKGRSQFGSDISHVTMMVQKVFKGEVKVGQELTIGNGDPVLGCSWPFYAEQVGETYLLYLYRPEKPGEPLYVSVCNRSSGLEAAHDDLLYLENMAKVRGRTRVSGNVKREGADYENVKGQRVRIAGKNKTYIATTDDAGVYELYDLPPGRYSIEPVLEPGWKIDAWGLTRQPTRAEMMADPDPVPPPPRKMWFTLRPKKHFGVSIRLRLDNKIAGRVTTSAGQPLSRVCVSLVPVKAEPLVCNAFTEKDGSFEISSVDAGSYNLVINYAGIKSSHQPFPSLYYPGVTTAEAAKVLEVKFAESIVGLTFVVPSK